MKKLLLFVLLIMSATMLFTACMCKDSEHVLPDEYYEIVKQPTCTQNGVGMKVCEECSFIIEVEIPMTGHSEQTVVVEPKCTERGSSTTSCTTCNEILEKTSIPAKGDHVLPMEYSDVLQMPTCTKNGVALKTCTDCGCSVQVSIPMIEHTEQIVIVEPKCMEEGSSTTICTACKKTLSKTSIPAKGEHVFPKEYTTIVQQPTCTKNGVALKKCKECDHSIEVEIPKSAHTEQTVVVEPKCTTEGSSTTICSTCKVTLSKTVIPAKGHNTDKVEIVQKTCTKQGTKYFSCSVCDELVKKETIPASHAEGEYRVIKEPTCSAEGAKCLYCPDCDSKLKNNESIPKLPHTTVKNNWKQKIAPTCTENGTDALTCDVCHAEVGQYRTVDALGHTGSNWTIHSVLSCITDGEKTKICDRCHETVTEFEERLGHKFVADGTSGDGWVITQMQTCETDGLRQRTCLRDGCSITESEVIKASGHNCSEKFEIKDSPTCTKAGIQVKKCTVCGKELKSEILDMLAHESKDFEIITASTCTTEGEGVHKCSCGIVVSWEKIPPSHKENSGTVTLEATCTTAGIKEINCSLCQKLLKIVQISPLGHKESAWITEDGKSATCTTDGERYKNCTRCGAEKTTFEIIESKGHNPSKWIVDVTATCHTTGEHHKECLSCGIVTSREVIPVTEHNNQGVWTAVAGKEATCLTNGFEEIICSNEGCDCVLDTREIKALGHDYNGTWKESKPATCYEFGIKELSCTRCDAVIESTTIAKLPHEYASTPSSVTASTCTTHGAKTYVCLVEACKHEKTVELDLAEHTYKNFADIEYSKEATCHQGGEKEIRCTECNYLKETRETDPLGHNYAVTELLNPTCTTAGKKVETCSRCNDKVETPIKALGHSYGSAKVVNGNLEYTCSRCQNVKKEVIKDITFSVTVAGNKYSVMNVSGGYGSYTYEFDIYENESSATPIKDNSPSTSYIYNSIPQYSNYIIQITVRDSLGGKSTSVRYKLSNGVEIAMPSASSVSNENTDAILPSSKSDD